MDFCFFFCTATTLRISANYGIEEQNVDTRI
jgi:hypothetical protein